LRALLANVRARTGRGKRSKMDDLYEAIEPELTDEEIEADYVDHLLQTAPPIV